jgi:hypothetical protein
VLWIEEFIRAGGNDITDRTKVYWTLPGTEMTDGLYLIENDSDILAMMCAVKDEKKIFLNVYHTNFTKNLRKEVIIPIPLKYRGHTALVEGEQDASTSSAVICASPRDEDPDGSERDSDSEFYDSDFDREDGDDDMFRDNIDTYVSDNNEPTYIVEEEDNAGLDHDGLDRAVHAVEI